jgi:hypothetical protein
MAASFASAIAAASGDEGSLWLLDRTGKSLVAEYNSGPQAHQIVGFSQPLGSGIISLAYEMEQAFCENGMRASHQQDRRLDLRLQVVTEALLAVPLFLENELCGILSCVQLNSHPRPAFGFQGTDLDAFLGASQHLQEQMEFALAQVERS